MITLAQLTGAHRRTYENIFREPILTDVRRSAVRSLLEQLGDVTASGENSLKITRNGHVLLIRGPATTKTEAKNELITLRHFLKRSEYPLHGTNGREAHLLLIIGHHDARLFRAEINGGLPHQLLSHQHQQRFAFLDTDAAAPAHEIGPTDNGAYFAAIAQALKCSGDILVFGESSETQVEMDQFIAWLKQRHPDLAQRVVGSLVLDEDQERAGLLLEKARNFYAHRLPVSSRVGTAAITRVR